MKNSPRSENKAECALSDREDFESINDGTISSTNKNFRCSLSDKQVLNQNLISHLKYNKTNMENIIKNSIQGKKIGLNEKYCLEKQNPEMPSNSLIQNPIINSRKEEESTTNDKSSENIVAMQNNTEYFEGVIIKETSIKDKSDESNVDIEINSKVSITLRESSRRVLGTIMWVGKINEVDVCEVEVKYKPDEDILKWRITDNSKNLKESEKFRFYVASHAIKKDVLTYLICKTTGISIIDPKSIDSVKKNDDFKGVWIIFTVHSKNMIAKLKWKGQINDKLCIGIELICESEHGSSGTFGGRELFECDQRKGVLVSIDKIKTCNLSDHQKRDGNDLRTLCCIESMGTLQNYPNFQIGSKVYDKCRKLSGICNFIGKVNGEDVIGIKTKQMAIDHNIDVLHFINQRELNIENCIFAPPNNAEIQSFYHTKEPINYNTYFKTLEIDSHVKYYPDRSKHDEFYIGTVKWLGFNDEEKYLCGIDLDKEPPHGASQYFLEEKLFSYKEKCGVIDEIYKVELAISEIETGNDNQDATIAKLLKLTFKRLKDITVNQTSNENDETDFIKCLSLIKDSNLLNQFFQDASHIVSNQFILFATFHDKIDESIMKSHLEQCRMRDEDLVNNKGTLEICKKQSKFDYLYIILNTMQIDSNNDTLNSIILDLALSCLKTNNMDYFDKFVEKCKNKNCLLNGTETFITAILKDLENNEISKDRVIEVLQKKIFDINQENSEKERPIQLAVKNVNVDIVRELLAISEINTNSKELTEFLIGIPHDKKEEAIIIFNLINVIELS